MQLTTEALKRWVSRASSRFQSTLLGSPSGHYGVWTVIGKEEECNSDETREATILMRRGSSFKVFLQIPFWVTSACCQGIINTALISVSQASWFPYDATGVRPPGEGPQARLTSDGQHPGGGSSLLPLHTQTYTPPPETHTHIHAHTDSQTHTHSHRDSHSLTYTQTHNRTHTHSHTLRLTHIHTHTHTDLYTHRLTLNIHTHTDSLTDSYRLTLTQIHSDIDT